MKQKNKLQQKEQTHRNQFFEIERIWCVFIYFNQKKKKKKNGK